MHYTWLPEAFISCLTLLALNLFIVVRHHLHHQWGFFFPPLLLAHIFGNVSRWDYEAAGVYRVYKLLSQRDTHLGVHSNASTRAVT